MANENGHFIGGLVTHAEMTDKRIEALREAQQQTNDSVLNLVGAIRDLIDRAIFTRFQIFPIAQP